MYSITNLLFFQPTSSFYSSMNSIVLLLSLQHQGSNIVRTIYRQEKEIQQATFFSSKLKEKLFLK